MSLHQMITSVPSKRYIVRNVLGRGGMGIVYRALDRLTGRDVALKRVSTDWLQNSTDDTVALSDRRVMLAHEFRLSASLRHPHIVKVLDYGLDNARQPYFTMELLNAPKTILQAGRQVSETQRVTYLIQTLKALTYLHRRGIIHRDIKPGNVVVVDNQVKVLDFGLSLGLTQSSENNPGLTTGTLAYIAPETLQGVRGSVPIDLYAVGMIAYELFAGQHPFDVNDPSRLINQTINEYPDISALDISPRLAAVIERLLQKDPADRYQVAAQVVAALKDAIGQKATTESSEIRESFLSAAAMVGRETEMKQLQDALALAVNGTGNLWLISGESGVGKSRLLDEIRARALVQGVVVARGSVNSLSNQPYDIWLPVLRMLCLLVDDLSDEDIGLLKSLIPDLHVLLQRDLEAIMPLELAPGTLQTRLTAFIEDVLRRYNQPVMIVMEDVHWAGSESIRLLRLLSEWIHDLPVLVLASYRDEDYPALFVEFPGAPLLKLHRLSTTAIERLSQAMLGQAGSNPQVIDLLQRETEGNVLFIIEVIRALAQQSGNLQNIGRMTLPQRVFTGGVETIIRQRLERLGNADRLDLQRIALTGRQLNMTLLETLLPGIESDDRLLTWAEAGIIEIRDETWRFAHDKLREGLIQQIDKTARPGYHAEIAQALEQIATDPTGNSGDLAYHWRMAGEPAKEEKYATRYGEQLLRTGSYREAISTLRRVELILDKLPISRRRRLRKLVHLRQRTAEAHTGVGEYDVAQHLYRSSLLICEELDDMIGIAVSFGHLGDVAFVKGNFEDARTIFKRALAIYEEHDNTSGIARTLNRLGDVAFELSEQDEARELYQRSLTLSRQIGEDWGLAGALRLQQAHPTRTQQDDVQKSIDLFSQSLSAHRRTGNQYGIADALYNLGLTEHNRGQHHTAENHLREAVIVYQAIGDTKGIARSYLQLGAIARSQNRYATSHKYLIEAMREATKIAGDVQTLWTLLEIARLHSAQSQIAKALYLLAVVLNHPASPESLQDQAETLIFQLEAELDPAESERAWEAGKQADYKSVIAEFLL